MLRGFAALIGIYVVLTLALMWSWSYEPLHFDVSRPRVRALRRKTSPS